MMLVAGIVFLTVMDGLTLFSRLQAQRMEALTAAGRRIDGYYRVVWLISRADSIRSCAPAQLELYCGDSRSELSLRDSALVFSCGDFRDTLLRDAAALRLTVRRPGADTMEIVFGAGFAARFPVMPSVRERHEQALDKLEKEYGYDEE